MGTSSDRNDMEMEAKKLRILEECGANAFMDLSTGDDIDAMRKQSLTISILRQAVCLFIRPALKPLKSTAAWLA